MTISIDEFKLKFCDAHGLYATGSDYDELRAQLRAAQAELEKYQRVHQQSAPWTDAGGHLWELRPNTTCVECPHCLFTFAAIHTTDDGYDCPACDGCSALLDKKEG